MFRLLISATLLVPAALADGVISQVADGGGWITTFILTNTTSIAQNPTVHFWDNNGKALSLVTNGTAASASFQVAGGLAPYGSAFVSTAGQSASVVVGYATLDGDIFGKVAATAVFRSRAPGGNDSEAAVPMISGGSQFILPFSHTGGYATGLAIASTSTLPLQVLMTFQKSDGSNWSSGAPQLIVPVSIPASGHISGTMTDLVPEVAGVQGTVRFNVQANGDYGASIAVLGLRFNPAGSFTSVQPTALSTF